MFFFGRPFVSHIHYTHLSCQSLLWLQNILEPKQPGAKTAHRQKAGPKKYQLVASSDFSVLHVNTSQATAVACRDLVMPEATAWLYAPLPNSSIEQWRMVVIVHWYALFVTSQYDVTFTFAYQRSGEVCWRSMHIILRALSLLVVVLYNVSL